MDKNDQTEDFVTSIKDDFYVIFEKPNISNKKAATISLLRTLHKERLEVIEKYKDTSRFRVEIGVISGKISGAIRSHRNTLMTTILKNIRAESPKSFEYFTLTTWREFAVTLFGNAPAKSDLLTLLDDNHRTTDKRFTPNGWFPKKAIQLLIVDHQAKANEIRAFHDDYVEKFHDETQKLKAEFDKTK